MSDQPLQDIRDQQDVEPVRKPPSFMQTLIWDLLLVSILLLGAVFRFTGIGWDQNTHMHPDERFLTMVATSIEPVKSIGDYFNTETSSLNPHNRGYGFYVYGTLPMFIVRYAGEWLGQSGYDDVHLVGRTISGLLDLGTLLLVFLIVKRLYQNQRMALIAALFYALSVLPIQLSHFFKEDTFMTFFATLTIYFAIRVLPINGDEDVLNEREQERGVDWLRTRWGSLWPYALFGIALGMAVSSKINAAPLALLLPSAVIIRFFKTAPEQRMAMIGVWIRNVAIAGFLA
ncbi:MAG: phospholipid carrier-dependent glycosyltransferase, partial [Anaerolineae bacterium]|nr:phospholipid carrier-dependent glycosyltransferase [Anaerolineae bacterium]